MSESLTKARASVIRRTEVVEIRATRTAISKLMKRINRDHLSLFNPVPRKTVWIKYERENVYENS